MMIMHLHKCLKELITYDTYVHNKGLFGLTYLSLSIGISFVTKTTYDIFLFINTN